LTSLKKYDSQINVLKEKLRNKNNEIQDLYKDNFSKDTHISDLQTELNTAKDKYYKLEEIKCRNGKIKWIITTTGNTISFFDGNGNRQIESGYRNLRGRVSPQCSNLYIGGGYTTIFQLFDKRFDFFF